MYLALEHFNNHPDEEGLLLQVDFEKAFDTVEHNFLFKTLEFLGFGNYLINLVKVAFFGCMTYAQRCRSMFNIGGYNSAFLPFFRDFEILGGILGFADFPSFNDFESLGVYSGFNENVLKQLKTRIRMHKINE